LRMEGPPGTGKPAAMAAQRRAGNKSSDSLVAESPLAASMKNVAGEAVRAASPFLTGKSAFYQKYTINERNLYPHVIST